ncbi:MAG: response regulator [Nevskia sp.]|nr:response regulator [Nevskia sp.]
MSTAAAPRKSDSVRSGLSLHGKLVLAYGTILLMFALTCLLVFANYQDLADARALVTHTYTVIDRLDQLKSAALQQQVDLVNYAVSRKQNYLSGFQAAREEFERGAQELRQLTLDNPSQQRRLDRIAALLNAWSATVARPILEADSASAGRAATAAAATEYGHDDIEQLYALLQDAAQDELGLLRQRSGTVDSGTRRFEYTVLAMLLAGMLVGGAAVLITRRQITDPVVRLTALMDRLAGGDTDFEVPNTRQRDEIGAMARGIASFRDVKLAADRDNWVRQHLLDINIGLQTATTVDDFAEVMLSSVCYLLKAGYGAFFCWEEARQELVLRAGFGYSGHEGLPECFKLGQGLVGQCARDRKPNLLTPVPEGYLRVGSALGSAAPTCLLLYPLQARGVLGVIELAAFELPRAEQDRLMKELLESAGLQLDALTNAARTGQLLERAQAHAEELQASEEELRATNDALQDKNRLLEEQHARLQESEAALTAQAEELRAINEELEETGRGLNEANDELRQTRGALEQKAAELERASRYKSEFLANMSHELRTPLNSVLILAKTLADNEERNLDADQVEAARVIHDSGTHLLELINDILDLSKVEAGKTTVLVEELPLAHILATCEGRFRPVAKQRGLALKVEPATDLPQSLHTDSAKLQQVLTNLLSNAFKFTERGRVTLRVQRPEAAPPGAPLLSPAAAVVFEVQDTGIGIPADKAEKIFAPFEQVDASTSRKYGGTGLGLAISRSLARLLGGDLTVSSTPGHGSVFRLYLPERAVSEGAPADRPPPTEAVAAPAPAPAATPAAKASAATGAPALLVIEDDKVFAKVLAGMVQKRGYRALLAHDAASGLALARELPAAILLDIHLPDLDGWSVLQKLKSDAATRHIPVHIVSGADETARGFELGAVGYLVKPVSKASINQALDQVAREAVPPPERELLVVGGDDAMRASILEHLAPEHTGVETEATGAAGLARLARGGCDCLVLGFSLPDMTAPEFLERAAQQGPLPPVVVYAECELGPDELLRLRAHTDSIVVRGGRSQERLLDEVSLFLHSLRTPAGRAFAVQAQTEAADLAGRTVLVVDDDMRNIFALSKVLRARGLNALMAQDGQKALAQLEQRNGKIDAVLMDIMMPGMDGYETTRRIRSRPAWAGIPIIAVTAKAMPGDREKCLEAGANDYLSKPVDVDRLLSLLRTWIPGV